MPKRHAARQHTLFVVFAVLPRCLPRFIICRDDASPPALVAALCASATLIAEETYSRHTRALCRAATRHSFAATRRAADS